MMERYILLQWSVQIAKAAEAGPLTPHVGDFAI
jgi:hypothetical protein